MLLVCILRGDHSVSGGGCPPRTRRSHGADNAPGAGSDTLFAGRVASYERYQGEKLVRRGFDAYSYFTLCNALDSHNAGRGRGGVRKALQSIRASCTVVAVDTDLIFPPHEGREWTAWIPDGRLIEISSLFGHDGFLLETAKLSALIL